MYFRSLKTNVMQRLFITALACLISVSVAGQHETSNIEELFYEHSTPIVHSRSEYTNRGGGIHMPYPILYVHGLVGSSSTWQEMHAFLEPAIGSMVDIEFCLNADGDLSTSNASIDIASFIPNNLQAANQYVIDFNCDPWGNCYLEGSTYQSNQSGIYKQAEAIGLAIDEICQATGKDKVILLGHSMGGVASREYLQNDNHWQSNDHRVAKLVTSGSPHIGVYFSTGLWKEVGDLFTSIDVNSEAVRDLKNQHTGFLSWVPGVFFWGGEESQDYMYDDIFYWHNVDVNSNGQTGNNIIGLNERSFLDDLEYSCLWDVFDNVVIGGDGDYNWEGEDSGGENLCSIIEHGFNGDYHCEDWGWDVPGNIDETGGHEELPEQVVETLWALDEPDDYDKSYGIDYNKWYAGFITPQANNAPYLVDYDDYIVSVSQGGGILTVDAEFPEGSEGVELYLYEVSTGSYINSSLNNSGLEVMTTSVSSGQYIVEFEGSESEGFSQYFFSVNLQSNSLVNELEALSVLIYPNPASNNLTIDLGDLTGVSTTIKLFDSSSKLVIEKQSTSTLMIDVSVYAKGLYTLELSTSDKVLRSQVVVE